MHRMCCSNGSQTEGNPLTSWEKSPGALVTDADISSDDAIACALRECNAGGKIISEETPSTLSSRLASRMAR